MKKIILLGDEKKIHHFLFSLKDQKFRNVKYKFNIGDEEVCICPYHLRTDFDEANAVVFMPSDNPDYYEANANYTHLLTTVPDETVLIEYDNTKLDNEPKIFVEDLLSETPEKEPEIKAGMGFFSKHYHKDKRDAVAIELDRMTKCSV